MSFDLSSLQGHFLIANRNLYDPNFFRSVVLMIEHHDEGASGVIVNRPSGVRIADALPEEFATPDTDEVVQVGGPVEPNGMVILHNCGEFESEQQRVVPGVFLSGDAESFERLLEARAEGRKGLEFRVYRGYAGWSPNQLEAEIARNDWHVRPATDRSVFAEDPYMVWEDLMAEVMRENRLMPQQTEHPEWN